MEKAVYINKINNISDPDNLNYNRIYFGEEFCQWLLPAPKDFKKARIEAEKMKLEFTCVTPYFSENCIEKLEKLLNVLKSFPPCEIVVNDWGSLYFIHNYYPDFIPVMGRLLTKQRRNIPILPPEKLSTNEKKYLSILSVNLPVWKKFLKNYKITRVEIDNLLSGITTSFTSLKIKGSIYFPYGYLTTTRLCLFTHKKSWNKTRGYCPVECDEKYFRLKYPSLKKMKIFLKGNTQIFKNNILPSNLSSMGIDRIIYNDKLI